MSRGKRLFDVGCATIGLVLAAPVLALAALGIRLSGPGPIFYRARRVGLDGQVFAMLKLRTMRTSRSARRSPITASRDPRVFPFGALLRRSKIDELPQLLNILRGDMSVIGPRPEDPEIVTRHYAPAHRETLAVRPGLASPGSLYYETHSADLLTGGDPVETYVRHLLPLKLALDLVYVRRTSVGYDVALVGRTVRALVLRLLGREDRSDPPELVPARALVVAALEREPAGPAADDSDFLPDGHRRPTPRPGAGRGRQVRTPGLPAEG